MLAGCILKAIWGVFQGKMANPFVVPTGLKSWYFTKKDKFKNF